MYIRHRYYYIFYFTLICILASCSWLGGSNSSPAEPESEPPIIEDSSQKTQPQTRTSKVNVEKLKSPKRSTAVEIIWQIPSDPVEGFVIHYGASKQSLPNKVRLRVDEIEKFQDPEHGLVFRYVLGSMPADKPVYVSISAYSGEMDSPESDVFEVFPVKTP